MKRNETREERALRRREDRLMIFCWAIVAVWIACLLCTPAAAAYEERLPAATEGFVLLGVGSAVRVLMRLLLWLDTGRRT